MSETGAHDPGGLTLDTIAVVGASIGGLAAAETLRHQGYEGRLVVIGDETHTPYDRPPLSKQYLCGDWDAERVTLPAAKDESLDIEWLLGRVAVSLDAASRRIELSDGRSLEPDGIVIATGARARRMPGTDGMGGVFTLRTLDDTQKLREALEAQPNRVVVVGAGFIGAEVAATCRQRGLDVTLVEPLEAPMARVLGPAIGCVFADIHRDQGVDVRLGVGVDHLEVGSDGRVARVHLTDGAVVDTQIVVVGIGVIPNTEWLEGSGLRIDGGVVCDVTCHVAPHVVAAGDVAKWPNPVFDDELMRIEHWDHAYGQGEHAARSLLAGDDAEPFASVPWFWSDQYDRKLQLAGRVRADDRVEIVSGSLDDRRFVALYERAGRLVGVLAMNHPRPVVQLRNRIAEHISFDEALATFAPD